MAQRYNARTDITILSLRVHEERQRAARATRLAARYSQQPPTRDLTSFYARMAALHRGLAERHLVAAELHEKHLRRVEKWLRKPQMLPPTFLGTVAAALGIPAAAATLRGLTYVPAVVAASDATASAAQELEQVMREGPFEETDFQPVVHQAAGMVSVYHGFGIEDADTLLRAHAFAAGRPVTDVAMDVVQRRTRLE